MASLRLCIILLIVTLFIDLNHVEGQIGGIGGIMAGFRLPTRVSERGDMDSENHSVVIRTIGSHSVKSTVSRLITLMGPISDHSDRPPVFIRNSGIYLSGAQAPRPRPRSYRPRSRPRSRGGRWY